MRLTRSGARGPEYRPPGGRVMPPVQSRSTPDRLLRARPGLWLAPAQIPKVGSSIHTRELRLLDGRLPGAGALVPTAGIASGRLAGRGPLGDISTHPPGCRVPAARPRA